MGLDTFSLKTYLNLFSEIHSDKEVKRLINKRFQSKISSAFRIKIAITLVYLPMEMIKLVLNSALFFKLPLLSATCIMNLAVFFLT